MVLVLSSMYSSNNNLTESSDLLNISGKRYNRNTSKTIWSYNPDDAATKVCVPYEKENYNFFNFNFLKFLFRN
jgi:hypothetical protein